MKEQQAEQTSGILFEQAVIKSFNLDKRQIISF